VVKLKLLRISIIASLPFVLLCMMFITVTVVVTISLVIVKMSGLLFMITDKLVIISFLGMLWGFMTGPVRLLLMLFMSNWI